MKAVQILETIPTLQKLMECRMPIKIAQKVYFLAKQINEQKDFFINEERKLVEQFNAEVAESGLVTFKSDEDKINFLTARAELQDAELLEVEPIEIGLDLVENIELTPQDLMVLNGTINFI